MSGRASAATRQGLGTAVLFVALLVSGLLTRPLALAFPGLFGLHAVLAALPVAFALSLALRKSLCFPLCFLAVTLFSLVLLQMSPIMGASSLAPMIAATLVYGAFRKGSPDRCAMGVGFAYGVLFYPCTIVSSLVMGGLGVALTGKTLLTVGILALLGAALSLLGAALPVTLSRRKQGD